MIPIPLTVAIYERGAAGAFTWQNPVSLAGRLSSYEDSIEARGGYKALRVSFRCSAAELKEWLDAGLLRGVRSYTPRGRVRWEGVLVELKATIGPIVISRSLDNMANVLLVSYGSDAGGTGNTATFSSAASIAEYGTKMLQADLSTTTAAGAANWAETELVKAAWPQRSREITLDGDGGGDITIELRAVGRYELLDWVLTSNTSTTTTATNTQAVALLTAYNATNNWFSTSAADVVATGHSDTEYIDPYTSYKEKLETILSQGNSTKQALAWGIYEDGALTVKVWAGATPSAVTYYRDARDKTVRDAYGNVVDPWDVLPDAMAEDVAILGAAEDAAAIATETREYIARVGLKIGSGGVSVTMEPDTLSTTSPAAVAEAIEHPVGRGAVDRSSRASAVGRAIKKKTRTIHQSTDNPETPTLTGGGGIDTGGGTITYPPSGGTGVTGSGTTGELVKWTGSGAIGDAVGGTDYAEASHSHTPSGTGLAPIGAKYIVQESDADLTNEQSLGLLTTGLLKNTVTASVGVLSTAVAGTDYVAPSALDEAIDDRVGSLLVAGNLISLTYNDAGNSLTIAVSSLNETIDDRVAALLVAGTGISLSYNDAGNALTISSTGGTVGGTGTAGRLMQWASGGADAENSTLIKSGAGVLTLSAASTQTITISGTGGGTLALAGGTLTLGPDLTTSGAGSGITLSAGGAYTLTIPATGTAVLGTGTAKRVMFWSGTNTASSDANFQYDNTANVVVVSGGLAVGPGSSGSSAAPNGQIVTAGSDSAYSFVEQDGSGTWSWYATASRARLYLTTDHFNFTTSEFYPAGAGTINLGNSSNYWGDISYKTLTDRGCFGWYDDGVELQDGRIVSDLEALKAIRPHPYKRTPAGAVRLDYSTLPRHVYKPAPIATEPVYERQRDGSRIVTARAGEPIGEDGAETTALISILLGAIKELEARLVAGGL